MREIIPELFYFFIEIREKKKDVITSPLLRLLLVAVALRCSVKKVFLGISQNSQENSSVRDYFLIKLQALDSSVLLKVWV